MNRNTKSGKLQISDILTAKATYRLPFVTHNFVPPISVVSRGDTYVSETHCKLVTLVTSYRHYSYPKPPPGPTHYSMTSI